ncbi:Large repetitive protein [Citrobacter freundii]|uniref:Large repetitive protein n=1 Tax=Citrobacter freundii TaxID=546 RepID=A0A7G2IX02_CITFR|nr:Large repetitive protein [Citrobacter freundii]
MSHSARVKPSPLKNFYVGKGDAQNQLVLEDSNGALCGFRILMERSTSSI